MAVAFYSDNIGKRMNEYLNLVLKKKIAQDERVIQEFLSEMRGNKVAEG